MTKLKREVHRIAIETRIARMIDEEAETQGRKFGDMAERLISAGLLFIEIERSRAMGQAIALDAEGEP